MDEQPDRQPENIMPSRSVVGEGIKNLSNAKQGMAVITVDLWLVLCSYKLIVVIILWMMVVT